MATILVVDDVAVIREPIARALAANGYRTMTAAGGGAALEILRDQPVDALVLDICMPDCDGLDVLRAIRADPALGNPAIVMLTDADDRDHVLAAIDLGVHHYLLKRTFVLDELLRRLGLLLRQARLERTETPAPAPTPRPGAPAAVPAAAQSRSAADAPTPAGPGLAALRPLLTRSSIEKAIGGGGELRALSPCMAELLEATDRDGASAEGIAGIVRRDHAIAIKVLKLANSALYARGERVTSIEQAVVRIGTGSIRQAVLNMAVIDHFSEMQVDGLDLLQFWEHSIACGIIAAEIVRATGLCEPDEAFTIGLLHDVGRLAWADRIPSEYGEVMQTARRLDVPLEIVEPKLLLRNHAEGMDRLLHEWKFPRTLIDPIVFHHLPLDGMKHIAPKRVDDIATLALANRLSHALLLGSSGNEAVYPTGELCRHLDVRGELFQHVQDCAARATEELKLALLSASQGGWIERAELHRTAIGRELRPLFIAAEAATDACRIVCEQLAARTDGPPNVAVLHVEDARQTEALGAQMEAAEQRCGAGSLPLVVLWSAAADPVPAPFMERRSARVLHMPATMSRIVDAFRGALDAGDAGDSARDSARPPTGAGHEPMVKARGGGGGRP